MNAVEMDDLARQRILTRDEEQAVTEVRSEADRVDRWRNAQCMAASFCATLAMVLAIALVLVLGHERSASDRSVEETSARRIGNGLSYDTFSSVSMDAPDCSWLDSGRGLVCREGADRIVLRAVSDAERPSEYITGQWAERTSDVLASHDGRYAVLASDVESVFRHSRTFNATLYDTATARTAALGTDVQAVAWNPGSDRENMLAFVQGGNVHVATWDGTDGGGVQVETLTSDAAQGETLNGIHSWVYEEEIFGQSDALWWSGDGSLLAYVRTDESRVPEMDLGFYGPSAGVPPPVDDVLPDDLVEGDYLYPRTRPLKYPKAGMRNPDVELRFHAVDGASLRAWTAADEDSDGADPDLAVLASVVWAEDDRLMTRWCDRIQSRCRLRLRSVRASGAPADDVRQSVDRAGRGWIERHEAYGMAYPGFYFGVDESESHVEVFTGARAEWGGTATCSTASAGIFAQSFVGATTEGTFFVLAHPQDMPWIKRLYRVVCSDGNAQAFVVDTDGPDVDDGADWVAASMARTARTHGLVLAVAQSPSRVPRHALIHASPGGSRDVVLEDNSAAAAAIAALGVPLPSVSFEMVDIGNEEPVAVMMARADATAPLGALFHVYGGPGSQTAEARFQWDWSFWVAMSARAHLVVVDGRGTGGRGTAYQHLVHRQLGILESDDQLAAARVIGARSEIDASRLFIWGWSYGGFMTLMTLARDDGDVFASGMAVAPVTDWRSYDSLYTERYQGLPDENAAGYASSSVLTKVAQIDVPLMLMHGTGDDNVHLSNSMMFLNQAIRADVHVSLMVYPDRNHGIYGGNTRAYLYDALTSHLDGLLQ